MTASATATEPAATLPIVPLPEGVCSKLTSSYEIASQEQVIEGLVQNALDARAGSLSIEADLAKGYISVHDDGTGIAAAEFSERGHLAKLHCKNDSARLQADVANQRFRYFQAGFASSCLWPSRPLFVSSLIPVPTVHYLPA